MTFNDTREAYFGDEGFSDKEKAELREIVGKAEANPEVEKHSKSMYRRCQKDRAITGLGGGIPDRHEWRPKMIIPANRFAEGEGIFEPQEEEPEEKPIYQTLDVVLVSPNLDRPELTWVFRQEGIAGTIAAKMEDAKFLAALENSQVKEKFHSPIHMKIKLRIQHVLRDGEWVVKKGGRSVVEVISPEAG